MTLTAKHISVSINRSAAQVYEFASNPENLPKWAAGLSGSIKRVNEEWIAESPMGRVKVKFAEKNKLGVLDHDVTLPSGIKVTNPMRVFPNNEGSELIFTLYRRPDVSDQEFAEDAKAVERDLAKLKTLLENYFPSTRNEMFKKLLTSHEIKSCMASHTDRLDQTCVAYYRGMPFAI